MYQIEHSVKKTSDRPLLLSLLVLVGFCVAGLFVGQFIGMVAALPFCSFDLDLTMQVASNPTHFTEYRNALLAIQAGNSLSLFVIAPLCYWYFYEQRSIQTLLGSSPRSLPISLLVVFLLLVVYMPFSGYMVYLNESFQFPASMAEIEQLLKGMEETLKELTEVMLHFDSFGQFLFGLFVIAVIPGVGEELLFRGVMQKRLQQYIGNAHIAIWLTAFVFSAFHFQFYGLLPRMFLGALFGYLYLWSGSLLVPMFAHFVNNGYTLLMVYLYHQKIIDTDVESSQNYPIETALASILLVFVILFFFKKYVQYPSSKATE